MKRTGCPPWASPLVGVYRNCCLFDDGSIVGMPDGIRYRRLSGGGWRFARPGDLASGWDLAQGEPRCFVEAALADLERPF